jgi:predicted dienelactone hydrolase
MMRRILAGLLLMGTFMALAVPLKASALAPAVQSRDLMLHDAKRKGLELPIRVNWTSDGTAGSKPLVIFSHGAASTMDSYTYLAEYWAQHGYICVRPEHADSLRRAMIAGGDQMDFVGNLEKLHRDGAGWVARARDISCVIDSVPEIEKEFPDVAKLIDARHIGLSGHSYGAYTTTNVAGARLPSSGGKNLPSVLDRRVQAIVAMSPQSVATDVPALEYENKQAWQALHLPAMFLTGENDLVPYKTWRSVGNPFDYSPAGNKYLVMLPHATHMSFSGPASQGEKGQQFFRQMIDKFMADDPGPSRRNEASQLKAIQLLTTAFWDAYLKGSPASKRWLNNPKIRAQYATTVKIESR